MKMRLSATLLFVICAGCLTAAVLAQESGEQKEGEEADVLEGHSYHGEAFNEGPRQQAYLMEGLGRVSFPVTTNKPLAQEFITQGVAQLHGFWYFEAERSFRQAAAIDPDCAMAYWGMALSNRNNAERAEGFIAEAVQRKEDVTRREQLYIEALEAYINAEGEDKADRGQQYAKALERLLYEFPDDTEAKAFLALQFWSNRSSNPIPSYLAVDALLDQVFEAEPMHPAHHYRIHLWDLEKPEKALASAALCGQSLPAIAHMWHMPGHIYSRLKRYNDAAWQQEASARVDHAHMMRDGVMPDQIHNFAHNNEWLIRNLNHVGRVRDAVDLAKNMTELPRHPSYNTLSKRGSASYGRRRLFETLSRFELWEQMIALCDTPYLEPSDDESEQVKRLRHLGRAQLRTGDDQGGKVQMSALRTHLEQQRAARDEAVEKAELEAKEAALDQAALDQGAIDEAVAAAEEQAKQQGRDEAEIEKAKAAAEQATGAGQLEEKDKQITKAIKRAGRPYEGLIKQIENALHELEGLQTLRDGSPQKAFKRLRKAGDVDPMFLAHVQAEASQGDAAVRSAREHVEKHPGEVQPLAMMTELYWKVGREEEARETFEQLRELSGPIDLDSPVFQRLAPLAAAFDFPADWRIEKSPPDDIGTRPELDSLGPFRWQPSDAPDWVLRDAEGNASTLKQYQGQPVILIFYLGYGCLHCAEQLQAFGPETEAFREAGIEIVAISTDNEKDLKNSIANYGDGDMPIHLLSNESLDVFRAYRAFDDFEEQPLHGTFLIDGQGRIRWQDISYEPFMDPDFLLDESQRLLAQ